MKKLRQQTGARIVPMAMCAWGLGPPAGGDAEYHRKKSWWLVSPELYSKHMHAPLKGSSPIPGVPLTRVAQQYAPALCAAWGLTVKAAFQEWHWEKYLQERSALHALEVCWQDLQCPAWPSDGAKSIERSLGTTTVEKPPGPQAGECPHYQPSGGCGLIQPNIEVECPFCGEHPTTTLRGGQIFQLTPKLSEARLHQPNKTPPHPTALKARAKAVRLERKTPRLDGPGKRRKGWRKNTWRHAMHHSQKKQQKRRQRGEPAPLMHCIGC